jgi:hypothetical protein
MNYNKYFRHVAKHMREISLAVLPPNSGENEEESDELEEGDSVLDESDAMDIDPVSDNDNSQGTSTGARKALLIGINYFGQRGQLRGCINDVKNMAFYLSENLGYLRENMVILTDDQQNPMSQPTKQNMLRAMHWLVKDAQPNDSLFFHYSGLLTRTN